MKWTQEELELLINNSDKMLASQLSELLPSRSVDSIYKKLKSLGIRLYGDNGKWRRQHARSLVNNDRICRVDQSIKFEDLSNEVIQILLGSMLGDGCSSKQSSNLRNYRFYEGHGLKQQDYLYWKAGALSLFKPRICHRPNAVEMVTKTHPIFTQFRESFYGPGAKQKSLMPLGLLGKLDLFGLMVWHLDDGTFREKPWRLEIGAKGWDRKGLCDFIDLINTKFSLSAYVYTCRHCKKENQVVKIPMKDKDIIDVWKNTAKQNNLPECMYSKLGE